MRYITIFKVFTMYINSLQIEVSVMLSDLLSTRYTPTLMLLHQPTKYDKVLYIYIYKLFIYFIIIFIYFFIYINDLYIYIYHIHKKIYRLLILYIT